VIWTADYNDANPYAAPASEVVEADATHFDGFTDRELAANYERGKLSVDT
jgi:hypothetical protein